MDKVLDPVRERTSPELNDRIDNHTLGMLRRLEQALPAQIEMRLLELEGEWDVDRAFEVSSGTLAMLGLGLAATVHRGFLVIPGVISGFLLQNALQGWCLPVALFRRQGFRTSHEILRERTALRVLRGDFAGEPDHHAEIALAVATRTVYAVD
ncbi:MAG: hypothetical protein H0V89_09285 [Deltaproteobacteria bacterium]|nr:hypothetical protein [Deltaproteobacteria bacterium]